MTIGSEGDGTIRNVAWEPANPGDPDPPACSPPTDEGTDPVTGEPCAAVTTELPRLTVAKTADRTDLPGAGEVVTYTVTATNTGPGDYTDAAPAVVTDDLTEVLDEATYNDDAAADQPGTLDYDAPDLTWSGPLAAGDSVRITFSVTFTGGGDDLLTNQACVPAAQTTPGAQPCALVDVPAAEVIRWKAVDASTDPVVAGTVLTYTLHFANNGRAPATLDVTDHLTDVLDDADVTVEPTATGDLTVTRDGDTLTVAGTLTGGADERVIYQVTVRPDGQRGDDTAANFLVTTPEPPPDRCEPADPSRPTAP